MHNAIHGIELLVAGAQEYAPSKVADGLARFQDLGLFIEIREVQSIVAGSLSVFISEFTASARERQKGITITCIGRAGDMPSAVGDAVAQWSLGVLPVLAQWRGKHSCFSTSGQVETQGGPFDLLAGPVIARGLFGRRFAPRRRRRESLEISVACPPEPASCPKTSLAGAV